MKIVQLQAENFKRLKAVTIDADGTLQVVAGRNAQGKSSVLDAIWWVLQQRGAAVERPVRDGEDTAKVTLTFEDLVITRTTSGAGAGKLTITSRDGSASYNSPQKMLDSLVGKLSLDPLAFALTDGKKQVEILAGLIDLGFDPEQLKARRKALYDHRTELGREVAKARGLMDSLPEPSAETPEHEVSAADIAEELRAAEEVERQFAQAQVTFYDAEARIAELEKELELQKLRKAEALGAGSRLAPLRPFEHGIERLRAQLREVDEINARVRVRQQREHAQAEYERLAAQYEDLTVELGDLDDRKQSALARAQMPVAGLGFDDDGVTYNGVPLSQASGAERLRVSTAIAMALNPQIRVIRITDGSLMDADSMRLIAEMAAERDFQVWVERVGTADGIGVVIEDGEVA